MLLVVVLLLQSLQVSIGGLLIITRILDQIRGMPGKLIDPSGAELPGADMVLEQDVEFTVRPALWFREAEVVVDEQQQASSGPEEARLRAPVPLGVEQHARHEGVVDDAADVVEVAGQYDGFDLEAGGWDVGNQRIADGADGDVVHERVDHEERAGRQRGAASRTGHAHAANDHEETEQDSEAPEIQSPTTDMRHQEP